MGSCGGGGNNGGDGYHLALIAARAGLDVEIFACGAEDSFTPETRTCLQEVKRTGLTIKKCGDDICADVIVDALLGIGLSRELSGEYFQAAQCINKADIPVLSIDVPSGLNCDTGEVLGISVVASATVTFITRKVGLYIDHGRDCCGRILFDDLDVPSEIIRGVIPVAHLISYDDIVPIFAPRLRASHKGSFGHVLVIGGAPGYSGAVRLAAEVAVRSGSGLVSVATHSTHAGLINIRQPEIMCAGVLEAADLRLLLSKSTVIAFGPGLGTQNWGLEMFSEMRSTSLPLLTIILK